MWKNKILNIIKHNFLVIVFLVVLNSIYFGFQINRLNEINAYQTEIKKEINEETILLNQTKQLIFNTIKDDLVIQFHDSNWDYNLDIIGMNIQIHLEEELPQNVFLVVNSNTKEFGFYYMSDTRVYPYLTYYLDTRGNLGNMFELNPYLDEMNGLYIHRYTGDYEDFNFQWAYAYDLSIGFLSTYELNWYPNESLRINFMNIEEES